jgi:tetratricopeptide (TPR) repeat protein
MPTNDLPVYLSHFEKRFLMEAGLVLRDARRYEEARAIFEGLIYLVEDKHLPMIGLGTIHFERGQFDQAIARFEEATEFAPRSAVAYAHLGEALAFARQKEEAQLVLKKAVELDPSGHEGGEMAKTIQKFLSYGLL